MRIKSSIGMFVFGVSLAIYLFCWIVYRWDAGLLVELSLFWSSLGYFRFWVFLPRWMRVSFHCYPMIGLLMRCGLKPELKILAIWAIRGFATSAYNRGSSLCWWVLWTV
jgi:hypothetical protein